MLHRLKLAYFTSLGFTPVSDKDGNVQKMLVRAYFDSPAESFKKEMLINLCF